VIVLEATRTCGKLSDGIYSTSAIGREIPVECEEGYKGRKKNKRDADGRQGEARIRGARNGKESMEDKYKNQITASVGDC
jgi:hypothetical protein